MEDKFSTFFQHFVESIALIDPNGRIIHMNPAFQSLIGKEAGNIQALGFSLEDMEKVRCGEAVHYEKRDVQKADGGCVTVSASFLPIQSETDCAILCVLRDRMELLRMEAALQESKQQLRMIAEHSFDDLLILSLEGKILYCSWFHIFEASAEYMDMEAVFSRHVHPEDVAALRQKWERLYETKEEQSVEFRKRNRHGEWVWMQGYGRFVANENQPFHWFIISTKNINERKQYEDKLYQLTYFDPLTGIANRRYFEKYIWQLIEQQKTFALCYLDFDKLKWINDHFSHQAGDYFLKEAVKRVRNALRTADFFARIGGDEFVLLLPDMTKEAVSQFVDQLICAFHQPFHYEKQMIQSTLSVGISFFPTDAVDANELMKYADQALSYVKKRGKNGYYFYQPVQNRATIIERDLPFAILREQFYLCYQPKIELGSGTAMGVETLLRWRHPSLGEIPPLEFIPLAEQSGFIFEITLWVLEQACRQVKQWQQHFHHLKLAVNLSPFLLNRKELIGHVTYILKATDFAPEHLILEVTESGLMENIETGKHILTELKNIGVQVAIDDFGTGFSSLAYIRNLPVSLLKIDRSFIQGIADNSKDATIVDTIIHLAKSLDIQVLAEGVETNNQLLLLQQMDCDFAQGFYFSKSLEAEKLQKWLADYNKTAFQTNRPL
ncbi:MULTISPECIES: putative bifunctional diguanylate cyclase/phosphodiesterase [Anoxybacillaceae]|uniref:putative bifunctional diguanylate cyclase/phosphodiesterase n=1 Tax=Anoxybacillaceae TaxID=3120669 RepID=UPI00131903E8|nr:bifunctional diguanylate cyclase/phosphodiesterase [Anoxybacillus sp. PDR2]QHC04342.1 EAL domain-containing protein [Anoxybacillus sp. PDR2]